MMIEVLRLQGGYLARVWDGEDYIACGWGLERAEAVGRARDRAVERGASGPFVEWNVSEFRPVTRARRGVRA